jgi:3-isopropylmalate/(R)-2-methylmalate dehydratase small subunit
MERFTKLTSTVVPLPIENVDTDQIIPARFLKGTSREGFGANLFRDRRYGEDGLPVESFVLNDPRYGGSILVAGRNFGSGSSREHAAWALLGYGFRVVASSFFADIFRNNAMNNGLLPVVVSETFLGGIFESVGRSAAVTLTVDLESRTITNNGSGASEIFPINASKRECFLEGFDDIDYLLNRKGQIEAFERRMGFTQPQSPAR